MRWRITAIVGVIAIALVGVAVGASADSPNAVPQAACNVPTGTFCLGDTDPSCEPFGAICDATGAQPVCVCPLTDMGPRVDGIVDNDGGAVDFATGGGGQPGGSTSGSAPREGGGTNGPVRSGCSFLPGSAY
jgi:hypothetical protein